jgi:hypothetical protein
MADKIVWDNSRVIDWARQNGYDGVIHDDHCLYRRSCHHSYVAFAPTQIKSFSATGAPSGNALNNIYEAHHHAEDSRRLSRRTRNAHATLLSARSAQWQSRTSLEAHAHPTSS